MQDDFKVEPLQLESRLKLPQFTPTLKIALAVGAVIILAIVLFFVFGRSTFAERNVILAIDHPSEIASGDQVTYRVRYQNDNRMALSRVRLTFYYPADAVPLKDGSIGTEISEIVDIGTIDGNSKGEKTFTALVVGSQGSIKSARVALSYNPDGLTTEIQKTADAPVTITSMPIQLTAVAPPTVLKSKSLTYIVDYRNQSPQTFTNVRILVQYPEGFTPSVIMPRSTNASAKLDHIVSWDIPSIAQGEGARMTLQGTITGNERDSKTLFVTLQRQLATPTGSVYVAVEKIQTSSVITTPLLSAQLTVQDGTNYTAHLKDNLKYKILLTNNSDVDLSSITLTAKLDGSMYDFATVDSTGAFDGRTHILLWNSAVVPELGVLRAHQSITIPFTVRIKESFPSNIGTKDSLGKVSVHAETVNVPDVFQIDSLSADDELITRISTATAFNQDLTVRDGRLGAPAGAGPYPPRVDQKTMFMVHWTLANPSNDVTPAKINAVLLPGVTWESKVQAVGTQIQPTYNSKTSTLTWDLGSVPNGVGIAFPAYELYFGISVTPSINQLQQTVPLLKSVQFEGTDVFTKEKIINTIPDITTGGVTDSRDGGSVQP